MGIESEEPLGLAPNTNGQPKPQSPFGEGEFDLDRELGLPPRPTYVRELGVRARRLEEMKGFPQRFWERV